MITEKLAKRWGNAPEVTNLSTSVTHLISKR